MSVGKHQACFTTKLQGQNLATFSHSAVMPIDYLQHTVNTNKTCVNYAFKKLTPLIMRLKKLIARQLYSQYVFQTLCKNNNVSNFYTG